MSEIYFLEPSLRFDDQLEYAGGMGMDTVLCPLNAGLPSQHTMRQRWQRPLRIVAPVQRMTDFEWTVYHDILIEKDILEALQSAKFTGVKFRSVELYTTTDTPIGRRVFELQVAGWGGMAPPESGIRVIKECSHCKRRIYSGYSNADRIFSPEAWDGSDFFLIWPIPRYTFVTKRVADFITKAEYSGLRIKSLDKLPKSIAGTYTPGHLGDWFEGQKLATIKKQFESYLTND